MHFVFRAAKRLPFFLPMMPRVTIPSPPLLLLGSLSSALVAIVVSFTFPTLESGYLLVSLLILLLVSITFRRNGSRVTVTPVMAAVTAITLAATAVVDSLDISFLGKGHDGESGLVLGMVLATLFVLRIIRSRLQGIPEKQYLLLIALLVYVALAPTYLLRIASSLDLAATLTSLACVLLLLPTIRTTIAGFSHGRRLLLSATSVYAIANATAPFQVEYPLVAIGVGLLWILAAHYARGADARPESCAALGDRLLVAVGIMVILLSGLAPLCGLDSADILLPAWLVAMGPLLWLIYRAGERVSVLFCGSLLFGVEFGTLFVQGMAPLLPRDSDILFRYLLTGLLLTLWLRGFYLRWRAGIRPLLYSGVPAVAHWSPRGMAAWAGHGAALAVLALSFYLPAKLLLTNTSPTRLLARHANAFYWPGLSFFITLAMHDDYLYQQSIPWRRPGTGGPEDLVHTLRKHAPDRFSHYVPAEDVEVSPLSVQKRKKRPIIGIDLRTVGASLTISTVLPDSPAARAGIERGAILLAVNHKPYTKGKICRDLGERVLLTVQDRQGAIRDVPLSCAEQTADKAFARIIPADSGPVGYLYIPSFNYSGFAGTAEALKTLSRAGVRDLVLDLRGNGGGKLDNEVTLANMLLGPRFGGRVLHRLDFGQRYRDKNENVQVTPAPLTLNLKRLVAITTEESCSASESIINDMRPFIPVRTIGATTCGKPMMMDVIPVGDYSSGGELSLLSATMSNADGNGGYYSGIKPDCPAKEIVAFNLGDPRENLLNGALRMLESGECLPRE